MVFTQPYLSLGVPLSSTFFVFVSSTYFPCFSVLVVWFAWTVIEENFAAILPCFTRSNLWIIVCILTQTCKRKILPGVRRWLVETGNILIPRALRISQPSAVKSKKNKRSFAKSFYDLDQSTYVSLKNFQLFLVNYKII